MGKTGQKLFWALVKPNRKGTLPSRELLAPSTGKALQSPSPLSLLRDRQLLPKQSTGHFCLLSEEGKGKIQGLSLKSSDRCYSQPGFVVQRTPPSISPRRQACSREHGGRKPVCVQGCHGITWPQNKHQWSLGTENRFLDSCVGKGSQLNGTAAVPAHPEARPEKQHQL